MDNDRLVAERDRIEGIMAHIREINDKLNACKPVKAALLSQRTSLNEAVENWVNVRRALLSDIRYTRIAVIDVFEGEMAKRLGRYMAEVVRDITDGITNSKTLLDKVQAQIGKLEEYEADLFAERASWVAQL